MDPLTHACIGGFSGKACQVPRRTIWIFLFLGVAPDLDFIANLFGSWAAAFQHRGITHSFVGVVLQALFYAFLFGRWHQDHYWNRFRLYVIPLGLHVFCDALTGYSVPLWAPFSYRQICVSLVVNLSIIPLLFMAIGWMLAGINKRQEKTALRLMIACWGIYFALSLTGKAMARRIAEPNGEIIRLIPDVINPVRWKAILKENDDNRYHHYDIRLLSKKSEKVKSYPMPDDSFAVKASQKSPRVQTFLKNHKLPIVRIEENVNGWDVEWGSIIFSTLGTVRSKILVQVDRRGRILSERKVYGFWDP